MIPNGSNVATIEELSLRPFLMDESQKTKLVKNDRQSGRFGFFLVAMVTFRDETSKTKCLSGLLDLCHYYYTFNKQH